MKINSLFTSVLVFLIASASYGQVGIGTNAPDNSSLLDVTASNKGILVPRVALTSSSDTATISVPANGLLVYNTSAISDVTKGFYYYDSPNSVWKRLNTDASLSVGAINGTPNSKGASLTSGVLQLTPADATNGGIVTTGDQTFAGTKTFSSPITSTTGIGTAPFVVTSTTPVTNLSIGGNAASATTAATSTIANEVALNSTVYPIWAAGNTGNLPLKVSDTKMSFNPSTGSLSATKFVGDGSSLTGIAVTADNTLNVVTDAATITLNCDNKMYKSFSVTLAGTGRTLTLTNPVQNGVYTILLIQDATGNRTITTYTSGEFETGTIPTLTTTPLKMDLLVGMFINGKIQYNITKNRMP